MYKNLLILENGIIAQTILTGDNSPLTDSSAYNGYILKFIDTELDDVELVTSYYYNLKEDVLKKLPEKPEQFSKWNLETETWDYSEDLHNQYLDRLKIQAIQKRNSLLLNSDWTELPSALSRLGEAKVAEWHTYRQALRDITKQEGYPLNVVWPSQPN